MQAVILAAGYAMRLRPLTEQIAKPLLPIGGRPMIDYIYDKIVEVPGIDAISVVTNQCFAAAFERWALTHIGAVPIHIFNDGTNSNEERLGAIGDLQLTIRQAGLENEDLLVVAGDNLFDFGLAEYARFWRCKGTGSCIAAYDCPDLELVKQYSAVELNTDDRVVSFEEKPAQPSTHTVGIAAYLFHRAHVPLIEMYLQAGYPPDPPGKFISWLCQHVPVYGYRFSGECLDIGDLKQLLHADNRQRVRIGLPERQKYTPDM